MADRYHTLPIDQWPAADRFAWRHACWPDERLTSGGAAAGMSPHTQKHYARCCGYFLEFCRRTGWLKLEAAPAADLEPETVEAFLVELQTRVGSVTRHTYLERILRLAKILDPAGDYKWLHRIERQLKRKARPRPRAHRVVDSHRLWRLGLDLMARAERSGSMTSLRRARLYRDGLMVAVLSVCTVRLGNFAFLDVHRHLKKIDGLWWMLFTAEETKSKRPDERPVPAPLTAYIDRWLDHWRGYFKNSGSAFWASTKGGGVAYTYVGTIITEVTRRELGVAVSPHLFRHSAVHTVAIHRGDQMNIATPGAASAAKTTAQISTTSAHPRAPTCLAGQQWV